MKPEAVISSQLVALTVTGGEAPLGLGDWLEPGVDEQSDTCISMLPKDPFGLSFCSLSRDNAWLGVVKRLGCAKIN